MQKMDMYYLTEDMLVTFAVSCVSLSTKGCGHKTQFYQAQLSLVCLAFTVIIVIII